MTTVLIIAVAAICVMAFGLITTHADTRTILFEGLERELDWVQQSLEHVETRRDEDALHISFSRPGTPRARATFSFEAPTLPLVMELRVDAVPVPTGVEARMVIPPAPRRGTAPTEAPKLVLDLDELPLTMPLARWIEVLEMPSFLRDSFLVVPDTEWRSRVEEWSVDEQGLRARVFIGHVAENLQDSREATALGAHIAVALHATLEVMSAVVRHTRDGHAAFWMHVLRNARLPATRLHAGRVLLEKHPEYEDVAELRAFTLHEREARETILLATLEDVRRVHDDLSDERVLMLIDAAAHNLEAVTLGDSVLDPIPFEQLFEVLDDRITLDMIHHAKHMRPRTVNLLARHVLRDGAPFWGPDVARALGEVAGQLNKENVRSILERATLSPELWRPVVRGFGAREYGPAISDVLITFMLEHVIDQGAEGPLELGDAMALWHATDYATTGPGSQAKRILMQRAPVSMIAELRALPAERIRRAELSSVGHIEPFARSLRTHLEAKISGAGGALTIVEGHGAEGGLTIAGEAGGLEIADEG